jgi:formylglycine-generating enzyme required for sulfatase activity
MRWMGWLGGLLVVASVGLCWPLAAADVDSGSDVDVTLSDGGKDFTNSIGMKLVRIPKGKFMMGAPQNEAGAGTHEQPQHEVELTKDFYLGISEVTQKQYKAVMGVNPSYFAATGGGAGQVQGQNTDDFPVDHVSWDDSVKFIDKLNALPAEKGNRRRYRLPTEAEWEYACRGGTKTPFSYGNDLAVKDANVNNTVRRTSKAGSYKPNGFGLYDMHGNVLEWCSDWYGATVYSDKDQGKDPKGPKQGQGKVLRGGSWNYDVRSCRSASRTWATGTTWGANFVGFRVACGGGVEGVRRQAMRSMSWLGGLLVAASVGLCWPLAAADVDSGSDVDLSLGEGGRDFTNSAGMKLVRIPKAKFMMGAPDGDNTAGANEKPRHEVELRRDFFMGACEVTQKQWKAVMGNNPSYFCKEGGGRGQVQGLDTDDFPVENVNWDDAQAFCKKLNARAEEVGQGRVYRLPTEAEWEYCCRGGKDVKEPFTLKKPVDSLDPKLANIRGSNLNRTCKVGSYPPNPFGLYDMHGNILEWCHDWYGVNTFKEKDRKDPMGPTSGSYKLLKGGAYLYDPASCRTGYRNYTGPQQRANFFGFRVVCHVRGR